MTALVSYMDGMFSNEDRGPADPFDAVYEMRATCFHEAAHAVVGYTFGRPIRSIGISVDREHRDGECYELYAGEVRHGRPGRRLSDATANLVTLDGSPSIAFENAPDRWAFTAAFLAKNTSTPILDVLDLQLGDFLAWHRQAARLVIGQHLATVRLHAATAALVPNSTKIPEVV